MKENVTLAHQTYAYKVAAIAHLSASVKILAWVQGKLWVETVGRTSSQKTSLLSSTHPHASLAPCPQQRLPKHPVLLICRPHHPSNDFFPICLPRWGGGSAELGQSLSFTIQSLHAGTEAKLQVEALDLGSPTLLYLPTLNNPALH